ncbi:uncharacterized protein LOC123217561 [Mangifera indica]|uniref:uncharacterized protein LOC123217561 n=1 Tax=Mangifera indica TaxID=29780 RepID=UPI001CFBE08D|nr:uncharacterized protein LOC123217561 [Mangifera indica]XP_044494591.1 uncharacterized protein LOC123217561 [Mangifera indica]XP_044494600.1 uncharacterized protein LOC123217561 [Mangifera indica]
MGRDKLLDSLDALVKRLIELSPKLNLLETSVLNGQGVPINQWQGKLEIFIKAIDGKINEKKSQSDCDVWVADVQVLAADVEEILNEIAGTQTLEEPSKNCFLCFTSRKRKAVLTVNDDLRTKIFRTSSQMATLDNRRREIGLQVRDWIPCSALRIPQFPNEQLPPKPPPQNKNNLHLRNKNNLLRHKLKLRFLQFKLVMIRNLIPDQKRGDDSTRIRRYYSRPTRQHNEPLPETGRIKTDSNPEIHDSEDDIQIF